jgi:hypothetical protein
MCGLFTTHSAQGDHAWHMLRDTRVKMRPSAGAGGSGSGGSGGSGGREAVVVSLGWHQGWGWPRGRG